MNQSLGCEIRRFSQCASTNDEAAKWAQDPHARAPHGGVVVAETQSAGRGRLGRSWHSPSGSNLYFSCILRPDLPPERIPPLTLCAGIALCEVVRGLSVDAMIKWPNDLLVDGKKLAGILTEMTSSVVIVGIGLNVNVGEFPKELAATSLRLQTGSEHDRPIVLGKFLHSFDVWLARYQSGGVRALSSAFDDNNVLGGRKVAATIAGRKIVGTALGLSEEGGLRIEENGGAVHILRAGEVELASKDTV